MKFPVAWLTKHFYIDANSIYGGNKIDYLGDGNCESDIVFLQPFKSTNIGYFFYGHFTLLVIGRSPDRPW
jgi:hypothetical protein